MVIVIFWTSMATAVYMHKLKAVTIQTEHAEGNTTNILEFVQRLLQYTVHM